MNYKTVKNIIFERSLDKKVVAIKLGVTNIWLAHYLNGNRQLTEEQRETLKQIINGERDTLF